jgi:ornithine decarboxylase
MTDDALKTYTTISDLIATEAPSEPVFCYWPDVIINQAEAFVSGFPGRVLYAVKCNPDRDVLRWLYEAGVRHFDTASSAEIELVHELFPDAKCYFNHPVKSRIALRIAHDLHGVRDFVVDHDQEFDKLLETLGSEILVEVRVTIDNPDASYDFSSKFGAGRDAAVALLKRIHAVSANTALSFHVGSQCTRPAAYTDALEYAREILDAAAVPARYINVGGGFPATYEEGVPAPEAFFAAIEAGHAKLGDWDNLPLYGEPGRALVADGMGILVQVHLRKEDQLYLNDGVFGSLTEIQQMKFEPPMIAYGQRHLLRGEPVPFKIFGPTCDPTDELAVTFSLPDDIDEGDWILLERMGAYSNGLVSNFNGFGNRTRAVIQQEVGAED